jgi:hypothetical protein
VRCVQVKSFVLDPLYGARLYQEGQRKQTVLFPPPRGRRCDDLFRRFGYLAVVIVSLLALHQEAAGFPIEYGTKSHLESTLKYIPELESADHEQFFLAFRKIFKFHFGSKIIERRKDSEDVLSAPTNTPYG